MKTFSRFNTKFQFTIPGLKTLYHSRSTLRKYLISSCFHSLTGSSVDKYKMATKKEFERLPKTVVPVNYKLKLQPDLQQFTFEGTVEIKVEVKEKKMHTFAEFCFKNT